VQVETQAIIIVTSGAASASTTNRSIVFCFHCSIQVTDNELFDSEADPAKLHDIALANLDTVWVLLQLVLPILNFFHRRQFLGPLVLQSDDLPSLLKVAILVIHLTIGLVQSLRVVNPV